jgi:hypothetical protein
MASFKKSAATFLSLPVFAVTDQYSRKVFNDLYFKRYKGQSEDRLRYFAQDLFEDVIKPAVFPGTYELIEKSRSLGTAAGGDHRRARSFGQAADGAPGNHGVRHEPARVCEWRGDRTFVAAGDGSGHEGFLDSHLRRARRNQPERLLRLHRQHERSADAVDRGSSGSGKSRHAFCDKRRCITIGRY